MWHPPYLISASLGIHGAIALGLAAAPEKWPWLLGLALADHVAVAQACLRPRSRLLGPNLTRLPAAAIRRGEVALTFDDGPDPEVTPRVLDLLAERNARASFFCVGRRVEAHPEIATAAAAAGHLVENHTHSHPALFAFQGPSAMEREIARAQEAIARACDRPPRLFRPPAGFRAPWTDLALHRAGLSLATWTRRGFDAVARDPRRVAARLLRGLAAGDILLLHDRGPRHTVLEVLPRLLDEIAARGLKPVPLPAE